MEQLLFPGMQRWYHEVQGVFLRELPHVTVQTDVFSDQDLILNSSGHKPMFSGRGDDVISSLQLGGLLFSAE